MIFLGDYVDGWGETSELIDVLIGIHNKANFNMTTRNKVIFIRGNHDVWCQDWLNTGHAPIIWTEQGGKATMESYVRTGLLVEQSHRDFFNNLIDWYIDEENRIFIHAGWDYKSEPFPKSAKYPVNAGTTAIECHWDRSLFTGAKSGAKSQSPFKATKGFKEVYIGHTATRSHLPENYGNLWNLDSGCGWHGKLTVMDIDTKEYWQSNFSKNLYPNEKGR